MSQSQLDLNRLIDQLSDAARGKKAVLATLLGDDHRLCPHVVGKKAGRWVCLFYLSGERGSAGGWLCVPLDDITDLEVVGGWHGATDSPRPQGCVDQVRAQAPA